MSALDQTERSLAGGQTPHDLDAEAATLGAILLTEQALSAVRRAGLAAGHFYRPRHAAIYAAMVALAARDAAVDAVTVCGELDAAGGLNEVGGSAYIHALPTMVPAAGAVLDYARRVIELAGYRAQLDAGRALADAAARQDAEAVAEARSRLDGATAGPADRYADRRYDIAALIDQAGVEPDWIVDGLLARDHLTALAAAGGEGKTALMMAIGAAVTRGAPVAAMATKPARMVIFDGESGPWVLGNRAAVLDPPLPTDGSVAIYKAEGLDLSSAEDRRWMMDVLSTEGADCWGGDSLRALSPGASENDSDEMAPVLIGARSICRETRTAGLLLLHRGHDSARDLRGSTAIRDQVDMAFVLEREDRDPDRRTRRRLRCSKMRIGPEPADRWLRLRGCGGRLLVEEAAAFEEVDSGGRPAARRDEMAGQALDILKAAGEPLSGAEVARRLGRAKDDRTVRRALDTLHKSGQIARDHSRRWGLSPAPTTTPAAEDAAIPLPDRDPGVVTTPNDNPDNSGSATVVTAPSPRRGARRDNPTTPTGMYDPMEG